MAGNEIDTKLSDLACFRTFRMIPLENPVRADPDERRNEGGIKIGQ